MASEIISKLVTNIFSGLKTVLESVIVYINGMPKVIIFSICYKLRLMVTKSKM